MDLPLIIGFGGTFIAIVAIIAIHSLLRLPLMIMGGKSTTRDFRERLLQRLKFISLVAIALLPMEGAQQILVLAKEALSASAIFAQQEAYLTAFALILAPVIGTYIFRRILTRVILRRDRPMGGFNIALKGFGALTAIMPFVSFFIIKSI